MKDLLSLGFNNWQQSDGALDVLWDLWGNWEDITWWLESIFVGDVADTDGLTFGADVREFTGDIDGFVITSSVLQLAGFVGVDAIAGFVSVVVSVNLDSWVGSEDGSILIEVSGACDSDESGNNELLILIDFFD